MLILITDRHSTHLVSSNGSIIKVLKKIRVRNGNLYQYFLMTHIFSVDFWLNHEGKFKNWIMALATIHEATEQVQSSQVSLRNLLRQLISAHRLFCYHFEPKNNKIWVMLNRVAIPNADFSKTFQGWCI